MIVKIGDVISEYSVRNKFDENIPVYSVTNEKGFCTGYFSKEVASKDKSTYKIVPRGYFAYNPSRINVGSVDWQKYEDRVIVSPLYVVFGVSDRLDRQYLLHYLKSDMMLSFIKEYATGSVRDNLKLADLRKFSINLRPVEEQRQIAATLDKIEDLIAKRRQQLDKLDELVKSRFIEMFGDIVLNPFNWEKELLGTVCNVRDGTHDSPKYYEIGYPLVTSKNVTSGKIDLTGCSLICEADFKKINERSKVDIGDIIMPMIGTVGNPVIVNVEPNFAIKNVSLIKFKDYSRVLNIFIQVLLQSDYFDDAVLHKVRGGTQKFISLGDIRNLAIIVPPMELQQQFAAFVAQTDKSKYRQEKCNGFFQCLEKSIRQEWLSCQILTFSK